MMTHAPPIDWQPAHVRKSAARKPAPAAKAARKPSPRAIVEPQAASPAPIAAQQAEPQAVILRFPEHQQKRTLKRAGMTVDDLRAAGFSWTAGAWTAPASAESRAVVVRLRPFLD